MGYTGDQISRKVCIRWIARSKLVESNKLHLMEIPAVPFPGAERKVCVVVALSGGPMPVIRG